MYEHTLADLISQAFFSAGWAMHWVQLSPSGKCATAGYTYPWGTKNPQFFIDINRVNGLVESIDVWGVDDNGGKGIFCGTLPLL